MNKNDIRTAIIALLCSIIVVGFYHFGMGLCRIFGDDCPSQCGKPILVHIVGFGPKHDQCRRGKRHFRGQPQRMQRMMMQNGPANCPMMQKDNRPPCPMMQQCPRVKGMQPSCPGNQPDQTAAPAGAKQPPCPPRDGKPAPEAKGQKTSLEITDIYGDNEL